MSKFTRSTLIEAGSMESAIADYRNSFLDIKSDGHVILLSCLYHGMPINLETGADGKSLKNPGNGSFLNKFLKVVGESHPAYVPRLKAFIKEVAPFEVDGEKVRFKEKTFRDMGGDRDVIFGRLNAIAGTWYDRTKAEKKEKARPDVSKKLVNLIKVIKGLEDLSVQERSILEGLLKIAELTKIELPKE